MSNPGSKDWAHKLVAEFEAGQPHRPTNVYRVAYEALGLAFPEGELSQRKPLRADAPKRAPIENPWWDAEPNHISEEKDE